MSLSFLDPRFGVCHQFWKIPSHITSNISSVSFFFFLLFPLYICYAFCNYLSVLKYSVPFSHSFLFLVSSISFCIFLRVSTYLFTWSNCSSMSSTSSIRTLSILIIVIFSSPSDNPKISILYESSSAAYFVSSNCVFTCFYAL